MLTTEYIEDTITMLDNNEVKGMSEAQYIVKYATSDDWKDRFVDEMSALICAIEDYEERNACNA